MWVGNQVGLGSNPTCDHVTKPLSLFPPLYQDCFEVPVGSKHTEGDIHIYNEKKAANYFKMQFGGQHVSQWEVLSGNPVRRSSFLRTTSHSSISSSFTHSPPPFSLSYPL